MSCRFKIEETYITLSSSSPGFIINQSFFILHLLGADRNTNFSSNKSERLQVSLAAVRLSEVNFMSDGFTRKASAKKLTAVTSNFI